MSSNLDDLEAILKGNLNWEQYSEIEFALKYLRENYSVFKSITYELSYFINEYCEKNSFLNVVSQLSYLARENRIADLDKLNKVKQDINNNVLEIKNYLKSRVTAQSYINASKLLDGIEKMVHESRNNFEDKHKELLRIRDNLNIFLGGGS